MSKSAMDVAQELIAGAERAAAAGDKVAFIALTCRAVEYLQLARLLGDKIAEAETQRMEQ